jgi:thiamine biosynthesis protein ThiS
MTVFVNDESKDVSYGLPLSALLSEIGMVELSGWAIAMNGVVVSMDEIDKINLSEGDRLIFIQATQGG